MQQQQLLRAGWALWMWGVHAACVLACAVPGHPVTAVVALVTDLFLFSPWVLAKWGCLVFLHEHSMWSPELGVLCTALHFNHVVELHERVPYATVAWGWGSSIAACVLSRLIVPHGMAVVWIVASIAGLSAFRMVLCAATMHSAHRETAGFVVAVAVVVALMALTPGAQHCAVVCLSCSTALLAWGLLGPCRQLDPCR